MKTIVAISDLHGYAGFEIPKCDLLLIAGDILQDSFLGSWTRHRPELCIALMHRFIYPWLAPLVYDKHIGHVCLTWGNHDWTDRLGTHAFDDMPKGFDILVDREYNYNGLTIWGSPWSNQFMDWAWMKEPEQLRPYYEAIPAGVDVIMSHCPPFGYGDSSVGFGKGLGSHELLAAIERVKPRLVVCGHIHGGFGKYQHGDTSIYNVSIVNEQYKHVNPCTEICLA